LLICKKCQTIDELPLFDGPPQDEKIDPLLDGLVRRHVQRHGEEVESMLLHVDDLDWELRKDAILTNLQEHWTGFHPEFYATKDTYREDAGYCFNRHGRPKEGCIDWKDDNKRLTPKDWQHKHVYLCDFCPVSAYYTMRVRMARGAYNKEPGEVD
jgi:hypothetical protein